MNQSVPRENLTRLGPSLYLVWTQAGFKKAIRLMQDTDYDMKVEGFPKSYPSVVRFEIECNGVHYLAASCTSLQEFKQKTAGLLARLEQADATHKLTALVPIDAKPTTTEGKAMDLSPIEARLAAASKGPWHAVPAKSAVRSRSLSKPGRTHFSNSEDKCILDDTQAEVLGCSEWLRCNDEDLEFMAHARADIEGLVAEVKSLRAAAAPREAQTFVESSTSTEILSRVIFRPVESIFNHQFYFSILSGNNKVIAVSEGYKTSAGRDKTMRRIINSLRPSTKVSVVEVGALVRRNRNN